MNDFLENLQTEGYSGEVRPDLSASYMKNITQFVRELGPVLLPKTVQDILIIVKLANHYKITLYPVSRGMNWGFGSRLAVVSGAAIVDLSSLNKIREINLDYGYAVVEPGVTQQDLALKLKEMKAPFYLDVTGSGADTSIIGNSLERGIAYNSLRTERVFNLEAVLGDGTLIKTGLNCLGESEVNDLYPHGIGPGLHHLFFQSNFGIVTAATIKLHRYPTLTMDFKISFSEVHLKDVFDQLRLFKQNGTIPSICRTGDFARSYETFAPLLSREYKQLGIKLTPAAILKRFKKFNPYDWTSFGKIEGESEAEINFKKLQIKRKLSPYAQVDFFTEKKVQRITKLFYLLKQWDRYCYLKASESLRLLSSGVPTDDATKITLWSQEKGLLSTGISSGVASASQSVSTKMPLGSSSSEVDESPMGFVFVVPLCPFRGDHIRRLVDLTRIVGAQFKVDLGITLNTLSDAIVEGVISLKYFSAEEGHQCMMALYEKLARQGYWPYRLNVDIMEKFVNSQEPFWITAKKIKSILDPNGIIAPKRYIP